MGAVLYGNLHSNHECVLLCLLKCLYFFFNYLFLKIFCRMILILVQKRSAKISKCELFFFLLNDLV